MLLIILITKKKFIKNLHGFDFIIFFHNERIFQFIQHKLFNLIPHLMKLFLKILFTLK